MPRWFSQDKDGHLGVFVAEHVLPDVVRDLPEGDLDLTLEISRMLRTGDRPVRGAHARVRAGQLQMIASVAAVRKYAEQIATVTDDTVVATFSRPQRGRAAAFMPGIRTFGTGEANEPSLLERVHADGLCGGCTIDHASDDIDEERLQALGMFVYECDEERETVHRGLVPEKPLMAVRIGKLTKRCLRYDGQFATSPVFPMSEFTRPS